VSETKVKDSAKQSHKAQMRAIELAKAELELRSLKVDLAVDEHRLHSYKEERRKKDNEEKALGIFSLERAVGSETLKIAEEIRAWGRINPGRPITLNIFSPGGSIFHGLALYDTLRSLSSKGHLVTTVIHSYAASMGAWLFLAGDVRIMGAEAQVMYHNLSAGTGGGLHDMEDDVKFYKRLNKRLHGIVTSRTKFKAEDLEKKLHKFDLWLDANEALRYGVATNID
jgi:ATP-dependent Clp protease protease subunit